VTWKCHNNDWHLASEYAKRTYYELLLKYKVLYGIEIFSYCLMDNHPHLTGRCTTQRMFSDYFRVVNSCFAKAMNKWMKRKGQMVMDRFKSPTIQSDEGLLNVIIYNDLNPSRTIKGIHPRDFKWSSYHHYAHGRIDPLLTEPECYLNMGCDASARQRKYRVLIHEIFKNDSRVPKCPYRTDKGSRLCFIGDPEWVSKRHEKLKAEALALRKAWMERYIKFLEQPRHLN
jgi:putative transposase